MADSPLLRQLRRSSPLTEVLLVAWRKNVLPAPKGLRKTKLRDGRALICDLGDRTQRRMFMDAFEPSETRLVRSLVEPGDIVIDVGAHIGWFTTICAQACGPSGEVIALEAHPATFAQLSNNVAANGLHWVKLINAGAGAEAGTGHIGRQSDSASSTLVARAKVEDIAVELRPLDSLAIPIDGRVKLLKVDVEGYEWQVLAGSTSLLRQVDNVLIEFNASALAAAGTDPQSIREILTSAGLSAITKIEERGVRRLKKSRGMDNYLFCRGTTQTAAC